PASDDTLLYTAPAPSEPHTLSLHDALPICADKPVVFDLGRAVLANSITTPAGLASPKTDGLTVTDWRDTRETVGLWAGKPGRRRSEEHTSELQSLAYLVCRLLLEKKKTQHS